MFHKLSYWIMWNHSITSLTIIPAILVSRPWWSKASDLAANLDPVGILEIKGFIPGMPGMIFLQTRIGFDTAAAMTSLLYSGEQFDSTINQLYLRQRWYNPSAGTFNRLDPFAGNFQDPQSLHKYLYTHGDPVNNIDPSGLEFTLTGLLTSTTIGAVAGGLTGAAAGAAYGGIKGGLQGSLVGAWSGLLWGAAAGGSIGGGTYALATYFMSLGAPVLSAYC
jgi:RHS repeat-associated protein